MTATATAPTRATPKRLSALDRWLPLWIGLAMIAGLLLGRLVPAVSDVLAHLEVGGISVPIGLGLLVGTLAGFVNGVIIAHFRVPPLIATVPLWQERQLPLTCAWSTCCAGCQ